MSTVASELGAYSETNGWRSKLNKMRESRLDRAPDWLLWVMTFINRIGFPIAVAIYLGYVQLNSLPKIVEALNSVNATLAEVKEVLKQNNDTMRDMRERNVRGLR